MSAEAAVATTPDRQMVGLKLVDLLLALSAAAGAITRQHYRMPTERERLALGDAVAALIRHGRLHGLQEAPAMGRAEAEQTLRAAIRQAEAAGIPRHEVVAIFNNEDAAPESARKDLQ